MKIIYKYIATDGKDFVSSTPHHALSVTLYPYPFVADYSNIAKWEDNG